MLQVACVLIENGENDEREWPVRLGRFLEKVGYPGFFDEYFRWQNLRNTKYVADFQIYRIVGSTIYTIIGSTHRSDEGTRPDLKRTV